MIESAVLIGKQELTDCFRDKKKIFTTGIFVLKKHAYLQIK
jgi:hypothetical protein